MTYLYKTLFFSDIWIFEIIMNSLVLIGSVILVSLVMDSHAVALPRHTICKGYRDDLRSKGYTVDNITFIIHHFDKPVLSTNPLYMIGIDHNNNPMFYIDNQCNMLVKTMGLSCVRGRYLENNVWKQNWCSTVPIFSNYMQKRANSNGYFSTKEGLAEFVELGYLDDLNNQALAICLNTSVFLLTTEGSGISQNLHHLITVPSFEVENLPDIVGNIPTLPQKTPTPIIIPLDTPIKRILKEDQCYTYNAGETPCDRYKEDCTNAVCTLNTNFRTQIISGTKNEMWINIATVFKEYKGPAYTCECRVGFEKKNGSKRCTDIDECASGTAFCDKNHFNCVNTSPGYRCAPKDGLDSRYNGCLDGFIFNKTLQSCVDINECENTTLNLCNKTSTDCINLLGGYKCTCKDDLQHENIDTYSCGPVLYEYRLLNPMEYYCCNGKPTGGFLFKGRKIIHSNTFTHLFNMGCLSLVKDRLFEKEDNNEPYVITNLMGNHTTYEAENLVYYSDYIEKLQNAYLKHINRTNIVYTIEPVLDLGRDPYTLNYPPIGTSFHLYTKHKDESKEEFNKIHLKGKGFFQIDRSLFLYKKITKADGFAHQITCQALPTNVDWLVPKLVSLPTSSTSLYKATCCFSFSNILRSDHFIILFFLFIVRKKMPS